MIPVSPANSQLVKERIWINPVTSKIEFQPLEPDTDAQLHDSETGDQYRARYQMTDVTRHFNSISRVCDQGNNVLFTQTGGWIISHETGRYMWFLREHGVYVLHSWINEPQTEVDKDMRLVIYDNYCMRDPGVERSS